MAVKPIPQIVAIVARDTSPPLYYLLDHLWMRVLGTSECSIRALTFLFFLGTVFFVYLIGKHYWDEKTGLLAAGLTFTNPFLFKYAFEGRMYALLALTVMASMYFFIKKNRGGHILATTAALYTHHFAIFAIAVQAVWQLYLGWGKPLKKQWPNFKDFLIVGLFYLPWLYPLYYQTSLVGGGFWLGKPTLETVIEVMGGYLLGGGGKEVWKTFSWISALKLAAVILLYLVILGRKWDKKDKKTWFLLGWFLVPIGLTFAVSQVFQSIFFDRYMLFVIPGAMLLLASNRKKSLEKFLILFIGVMFLLNLNYFVRPTKRNFRDFANLVGEKIDNHDFLINYNAGAHHLFESKYYGLKAPLWVPEGSLPFYVGTALMGEGDIIKEIPKEVVRLGVITSGSVEEVKVEGFARLASFEVGDLKFVRLVPNHFNR